MSLQEHSSAVNCLDYSKDGKYLASGGNDSKAIIWDTSSYEIMHTLSGIPNGVNAVRFSLDSKKLFTSNEENENLFIWDTEDGSKIRGKTCECANVRDIQFHPDSDSYVYIAQSSKVTRHDISTLDKENTSSWG